jgi:hypothetical protein
MVRSSPSIPLHLILQYSNGRTVLSHALPVLKVACHVAVEILSMTRSFPSNNAKFRYTQRSRARMSLR